jgi:para-nitrobenzyl esterase
MVWCHGGAFSGGVGDSGWQEAGRLAARGDVVVVSFNHRLNAFGFLYLDEVGSGWTESTANLGMLDIVALLEWVSANIASFGGDPDNVTLFGVSGGGSKVSTLMAMPAARGLFHKAIVQSGPCLRVSSTEEATDVALRLLESLEIAPSEVRRLLDVPSERLADVAEALEPPLEAFAGFTPGGDFTWRFAFLPVLDGVTITAHPFEPIAHPLSRDVPLLIGINRREGVFDASRTPSSLDGIVEHVMRLGLPGPAARRLIDTYVRLRPAASTAQLYRDVLTDIQFRIPTVRQADLRSQASEVPVFVYEFEARGVAAPDLGTHALEVPFVFDRLDDDVLDGVDPESAGALAHAMCSAWSSFARTGDPSTALLPSWPRYATSSRQVMVLGAPPTVLSDPAADHRHIFDSLRQQA